MDLSPASQPTTQNPANLQLLEDFGAKVDGFSEESIYKDLKEQMVQGFTGMQH